MSTGRGLRVRFGTLGGVIALLVTLHASAQPAPPDKLRFSIGIDPAMSLTLVAKQAGIFKKYNIDAEVIQAESGGAALEMTVAGQTDGATTTELPGVRARTKGAKIVILAALAAADGFYVVVVNDTIHKPTDIAGKKVGVAKGTGSEFFYHRFLETHKIAKDGPKVTYISAQEMIPALIGRDLDAIVTWEPWVTNAMNIAKGVGAHPVVRGSQQSAGLDQDFVLFLYVSESLAKNKDLSERVLKTYLDAEEFMRKNPAETRKIVADGFKLSPALVDSIFALTSFNVNLNQRSIKGMKLVSKWMLDNRLVDKEPDWDGFIRPEFLRAVSPDRVN